MKVELLSYTPNPEELIEKCGRTCYKSPEKDTEHRAKFIRGIVRAGHTAVIEHASATFRISEISRALTHQLVRHRLFSFCQQSQRYVKETQPTYFIPDIINREFTNDEILQDKNNEAKLSAAKHIYTEFMRSAWATYKTLSDLGLKKEDARYVLPNAAYTEICVTGNFREWYNFLKLRCDVHAQLEIRMLAYEILNQLYEIAPNIFEELKANFIQQDIEIRNTQHVEQLTKKVCKM